MATTKTHTQSSVIQTYEMKNTKWNRKPNSTYDPEGLMAYVCREHLIVCVASSVTNQQNKLSSVLFGGAQAKWWLEQGVTTNLTGCSHRTSIKFMSARCMTSCSLASDTFSDDSISSSRTSKLLDMYPDSLLHLTGERVRGVSGGLDTGERWSGELGRSVVTLSTRESCLVKGSSSGGGGLRRPSDREGRSGVGVASWPSDKVLLMPLCFFSMLGLKRALRSAKSEVDVL